MKYHNIDDNFLETYNPQNLSQYLKLRWREAGEKTFMDTSERVLFQVIRKGKMEIELGTEKYKLLPGYGIAIDLSHDHAIKVDNWKMFDAVTFIYTYRTINSLYKSLQPSDENILSYQDNGSKKEGNDTIYLRPMILQITDDLEDIIAKILNPLKSHIFGGITESKLSNKILLINLFRLNNLPSVFDFLNFVPKSSLKGEFSTRIKEAREYIHHNYYNQISIEELAETLNINKFYFIRSFKDATGFTPYEYISKLRVEKAKEFLSNTQMPIGRIGKTLGFQSISGFSNFFAKETGESPSNYRKENNIEIKLYT